MIYVVNTPVITVTGTYHVVEITPEEAHQMLMENEWQSAVGHDASARLLSLLLGVEIPVNRIAIQVGPGDVLICFKLKKRLPEGTVIDSVEELEKIGYDLWAIFRDE
jgi:hypothetical protein